MTRSTQARTAPAGARLAGALVGAGLAAGVLAGCVLAGCGAPDPGTNPAPDPSVSPGPSLSAGPSTPAGSPTTSPTPSPSGSELTAEQDLAVNPPAPRSVRISTTGPGRVELVWDVPPPVGVPHRYSDRVVGYRVYRQGPGQTAPTPVATTADLGFVDREVTTGRWSYVVSSVREQGLEGTRSAPAVTADVP